MFDDDEETPQATYFDNHISEEINLYISQSLGIPERRRVDRIR